MSANYSSVVLAKGPIGYWRLGEAAGPTAVDASGGSVTMEHTKAIRLSPRSEQS
jgi:hypothetical protein